VLVYLVHWRSAETEPLVRVIQDAGHHVEYDPAADGGAVYKAIRRRPPDAVVIDLSRLPSHGRELAIGLRGAKSTRHVPIIFVGGASDKAAAIRSQLPDAIYVESASQLGEALEQARTARLATPVVPVQMMDRYGGRTVAQKLGIREGSTVGVIDPPSGYTAAIGELPAGARFDEDPRAACEVTLWFIHDLDGYRSKARRMRALAGATKLWILWRKKSAAPESGLSERVIRETAASVGLVDYKICAVDRTWSAMAFAVKKA
jgi:CheY-like chemotaxis protein